MKKLSPQSWGIILLGLGVLFFQTGGYWSATWLSKWALMIACAMLGFSVWAARRTSWLYFPLLVYLFGSLFMLGVYPQSPYSGLFDEIVVLALQKNALFGILEVTGLVGLFALVSSAMAPGITILLAAIWVIGTMAIVWLPFTGPASAANNGLWFGNPSMGASLLACLLPFFWAAENIGFNRFWGRAAAVASWFLTLLAISGTHASVPWGVLGVVTAGIFYAKYARHHWRKMWVGVFVVAAAMITVGQRFLGYEFWNHNGRFEIWNMAWTYFWTHAHPAIGLGYSSSQVLLPIEQIATGNYHGFYYLWLHNDWLQLAFEGGYIGMACVFLVVGRLYSVTKPYPALFGSFLGFSTLGLFNYPLRMPIHCLCLTLICGVAEMLNRVDGKLSRPTQFADEQRINSASALRSDHSAACSHI